MTIRELINRCWYTQNIIVTNERVDAYNYNWTCRERPSCIRCSPHTLRSEVNKYLLDMEIESFGVIDNDIIIYTKSDIRNPIKTRQTQIGKIA